MATPLVKICGINSRAALDAAIDARADYCGFMFYPPSPRNISLGDAAQLAAHAAKRIRKIGVMVNPDDQMIADAIAAGKLDALQLHGGETPERVAQVKAQSGIAVWKVLPVASAADIERASHYQGTADLILFDAKTPKGALPGGMGLAFDWSLLGGYRGAAPWGLAGGLTPANVAHAARLTRAPLVDTSSGVESAPGIKDTALIAAFCAAARENS